MHGNDKSYDFRRLLTLCVKGLYFLNTKGKIMKKITIDWKNVNWKKLVISALVGALISFLIYYIFLPPINPQSPSFWIYLSVVLLSFLASYLGINLNGGAFVFVNKGDGKYEKKSVGGIKFRDIKLNKIVLAVIVAPIVIAIVGGIFSSPLFLAKSYANVITVDDTASFEDDMPETTDNFDYIALMDTESAIMLGNRELGVLSSNVSQYTLSTYYTQINYRGLPKKVANLEYDGFFKWLINNKTGIPGAVIVDPVNPDAEYIEFEEPMYYAESAFLSQDLERKLRFEYPTKIFHSISFEIDDNNKPYYIVACSSASVSLFGAMDISEVIVFDPTDASSEIHPIDEVPSWIDIVYTGELACEKYDWYGTLSGGFINSIIGNKGCKQTTDDFGYIALNDDVWYFTGVTSVTGDDMSNIGFILSNARTGEYKFYPVIGAEEHSAMNAAEGEVQEKGYKASFPSLVNISGEATYIMVLKDATGIVKLYAFVNVENYRIVATGTTQTEAMSEYKKLLNQNGVTSGGDDSTDITVSEIVYSSGTVYLKTDAGTVYKGYLSTDESLILINVGDVIKVEYTTTANEKIFNITSWEYANLP